MADDKVKVAVVRVAGLSFAENAKKIAHQKSATNSLPSVDEGEGDGIKVASEVSYSGRYRSSIVS